jgi:hypothetical protein
VPTIAEISKAKRKLVGTLALCPPYCCLFVVPAKARRDAEFALIFQLHLTVAP